MRHIVFKIGDHAFRARLNDKTPNICDRLLSCLPVETFAVHAKFAGDEIITMVPFYAEPENEILEVSAGDVGYYPARQTICLFYGKVTPFGPVSVFASLEKPFEVARAAGLETLKRNSLPVSIRVEDPDRVSGIGANSPGFGSDVQVPAFVSEYWRQVWLTTPADLLRLRQIRRLPSGSMPSILYACSDLFWLGEELQVLRKFFLKQLDQFVTLESPWQVATGLIQHHALRLEKLEMTDTSSFLRQLVDFFSSGVQNARIFLSVLEASWVALNRMQSWIDATISWNTLDQYQREAHLNLQTRTSPN